MNNSVNEYLYSKDVTCPVCGNEFNVYVVRKSNMSVERHDTDGHAIYKNVSPLLYEVWCCSTCGYTACKDNFHKLSQKEVALVNTQIRPKWRSRFIPSLHNHELAIDLYKLALSNGLLIGSPTEDLSFICLKIAWLYRELGDKEMELAFLQKALSGFTNVFTNGRGILLSLSNEKSMYLLADLCARVGDYDKSLVWLNRVITAPLSPADLKDKSRDLRDRVKKAMIPKVPKKYA